VFSAMPTIAVRASVAGAVVFIARKPLRFELAGAGVVGTIAIVSPHTRLLFALTQIRKPAARHMPVIEPRC
jgi:hypothetical protein